MNEIPSTIIEQIEDIEDRDINYRTLHVGLNVYNDDKDSRNFKVPYLSILNKHSNILSKIILTKELTSKEYAKYAFRPKLFSDDMYGTTEFWDTVLFLNNCKSVVDFRLQKVKYYDPDKFKAFIDEIFIVEGIGDIE
jgi:hypothetical protein